MLNYHDFMEKIGGQSNHKFEWVNKTSSSQIVCECGWESKVYHSAPYLCRAEYSEHVNKCAR